MVTWGKFDLFLIFFFLSPFPFFFLSSSLFLAGNSNSLNFWANAGLGARNVSEYDDRYTGKFINPTYFCN